MAGGQLQRALQGLRQALLAKDVAHLADADLLERFVACRDDVAFTVLVQRYSGLVFRVCRNILPRDADAEDAFQATFLVLARKAAGVRRGTSVASWLHRVAFRAALDLRKNAIRRRQRERSVECRPSAESPVAGAALSELRACLDEEIERLSETHRAAFLLCCLEGKSRTEAAQILSCTEGTLASRLARARAILQRRLAARGVTLSAALAAVALSPGIAAATPVALVHGTVEASLAFAAGHALESVSNNVVILAEGVLTSMFLTKFKIGAALLFTISLAALTAAGGRAPSDDAEKKIAAANSPFQAAIDPLEAKWDRPPQSEDEKAIGTLELIWFQDRARGSAPALILGSGTMTLAVTADAVGIVPDDQPLAVDGGYIKVDGKPALKSQHHRESAGNVLIHRAAGSLTSHRLKAQAKVAAGDALAAMFRYEGKEWRVRPNAAKVTALNCAKELYLPRPNLRFMLDGLIEIDRVYPEGTPFFKDGRLAGITQLGSRFLGKDALHSYLVPADHLAALCDKLLPYEASAPEFLLPERDYLKALAFDGKNLVSVTTDRDTAVSTWNVAQKKRMHELKFVSETFDNLIGRPVILSADAKRVLGAINGKLGIWDCATGRLAAPLTTQATFVGQLDATPDLSLVACEQTSHTVNFVHQNAKAFVWDVKAGAVVQTVTHVDAVQLLSIALSPDGKWLATGGILGGTCLWETRTGKLRHKIPNELMGRHHPDPDVSKLSATQILCLRFSPDSQQLAIGDMLSVKLANCESGKVTQRFDLPLRAGAPNLAFSKDGRRLARFGRDKLTPIWSTESGKLLAEIPSQAHLGAISDDGQWIAAGTFNATNNIAIWSIP